MTINDLEANTFLLEETKLHREVSDALRAGRLGLAAVKASELHALTRKLDWRIQELLTKEKP